MGAKVLNKTILRKLVRKLEDMDDAPILPDGMSREENNLMVKVMSAKSMSDIEDVSLEELESLFDFIDTFADFIEETDCFTGKFGDFESNLLKMSCAVRRRLL